MQNVISTLKRIGILKNKTKFSIYAKHKSSQSLIMLLEVRTMVSLGIGDSGRKGTDKIHILYLDLSVVYNAL